MTNPQTTPTEAPNMLNGKPTAGLQVTLSDGRTAQAPTLNYARAVKCALKLAGHADYLTAEVLVMTPGHVMIAQGCRNPAMWYQASIGGKVVSEGDIFHV